MLYLNVNEHVMKQWGTTIDRYYALHLGSLNNDIKSVNMLIEEEPLEKSENRLSSGKSHSTEKRHPTDRILYRVSLSVITNVGETMPILIEREHCGDAIEQCFAKAKRYMMRRTRGFSSVLPSRSEPLGA